MLLLNMLGLEIWLLQQKRLKTPQYNIHDMSGELNFSRGVLSARESQLNSPE